MGKGILIGIVSFLVFVILVGVIVVFTAVSMPSHIKDHVYHTAFGSTKENDKIDKQLRYIKDYTKVSEETEEEKNKMVEALRQKLLKEGCHEVIVEDNFWITWIDIMTIDSIRVQQNFKKFNRKMALQIGIDHIKISYRKQWRIYNLERDDGTVEEVRRLFGIITVEKAPIEDAVFHPYYLKDNVQKSIRNAKYMSDFLYRVYAKENIEDEAQRTPLPSGESFPQHIDVGEGTSTNVNYFNQTDPRWGNKTYGPNNDKGYDSYYWSGCGPTAAAIIFSTLKKDPSITPEVMGDFFSKNGDRVKYLGTSWACMVHAAKKYGCHSEMFHPERNKLIGHLKQGRLISTVQGRVNNELYRGSGHFIVLNGIREKDGVIEVFVTDPAFSQKNGWWNINIVLQGSKTMTAVWN